MKKIGFIGAYDKTDLIINIAKILTTLKKNVLIIDTTITQKAKYVVPVINPTISYITEFEGIDISVGFYDFQQLKDYLGMSTDEEFKYDYVLIDIDSVKAIEAFAINEADKNYFVTAFDLYSLKKGLEILSNLKDTLDLTKVLFSKDIIKEDDEYLNFLSLDYKIKWQDYRIYFPIENGDLTVLAENQRVAKIKFKKLSTQYKDGLASMVEEIASDVNLSTIKRAIKIIEKGV